MYLAGKKSRITLGEDVENHEERQHATLSPSTAERWFNCPGSLRLSRGRRSVSGEAAIIGTTAHEYASDILAEKSDLDNIPDDDMRRAVQRYVEFVYNLEEGYSEAPEYLIEEQVDLRHLGGDCWGTLDYASWNIGRDLYVVDYKHGIVPVEVPNNKQLMIYALGLLEEIGYDFKYIYIVIVQPRAAHVGGPIRSQRLTPNTFKVFKKQLEQAMAETKDKYASLAAGTWCQYCPAIGRCPEIVGTAQALAKVEFGEGPPTEGEPLPSLNTITDDQLGVIIEHTRAFRAWLDGCSEEAVARISAGRELSGLKLVRSPGRARWKDPDNLPTELTIAKPMTITEAKQQFDDLEEFIERPEGKIVAVSSEDGRALYISPKVEFN